MEQINRSSMVSLASIHTLNARESLHHIRRLSEDSYYESEIGGERYWRLSYLKGQFRNLDLTNLFHRYTQRINHGYFSLYLILQAVLSATHFIIVLCSNMEINSLETVLADLLIYFITFILSLTGFLITDRYVKKYPKLLTIASVIMFVILFLNNFFIPFYHRNEEHLRPAYTTHIIITCYIFLNVKHSLVALLLGAAVTIVHVMVEIFITYKDKDMLGKRLASDVLYLVCINGLGMYFRFLNEIVKRKCFLDRRACVESTLKLNFEKEQEEQLMLSIIPKHIIEEVRRDLLFTIQHIEKTDHLPTQKPFVNPYINEHSNVTILYADIENYTEMTTKLKPPTKLVETLNELFGRFDDASEDFNVLRIKFLGDCYYCVAGLPPNPVANHAEACVDLGLQMIKIIREVREHRNLSIDMRIGVHSGSVLSGLIGLMKWQFDVWSKDVDIANRMETRGQPGKVHITKQTRDLLQKNYNIKPWNEGETDPILKQHNIQTFLVSPPVDVIEIPQATIIPTPKNGSLSKLANIDETEKSDTSSIESIAFDYHQQNRRNTIFTANGNVEDEISINPDYAMSQRRDSKFLRRPSGNPALGNIEKRMGGSASAPYRHTNNGRRSATTSIRERRNTPSDVKRRTAFMDNNINRYIKRLRDTDIHMKNAIETMPLSKYEQWFKAKDINSFFLIFKDLRKEIKFIQLPDPLFKYYLLAALLALILIFVIQNLTLVEWRWSAWLSYATIGLIVLCLLPIVWLLSLWNRYSYRDRYFVDEKGPKRVCFRFVLKLSEAVPNNVIIRTVIYLVICCLIVWCVFQGMVDCQDRFHDIYSFVKLRFFEIFGYRNEYHCIVPWHMTETCALTILVSFSFLRIHMWIKFIITSGITAFYCTLIWNFADGFYEDSQSINHLVKPRIAHIITIIFLTITLHLIDRQTDYMNRLDFQWNEKLVDEREEANTMHKINNILLKNILPVHVADLYLNLNRQTSELYHENYECVAVMFASIVDYAVEALNEKRLLGVMNQIIGDFDKLLNRSEGKKIEKIKVAKWTYMAACGLDPGRRDSYVESSTSSSSTNEHVVVSLVKFAVDMIEALENINAENFQQIKLRIGIAHGELTAGVIGSKKPLYDIWGDPVNLASRMDSMGVPGRIQVPQQTAEVLMNHSIMCQYRDDMNVKGIEHPVPTYFVSLDRDNKLIVV